MTNLHLMDTINEDQDFLEDVPKIWRSSEEIHPANPENIVTKEFQGLYERIINTTAGASAWHLPYYHMYPNCGLMLEDGFPVYYVREITGDFGQTIKDVLEQNYDSPYIKTKPFRIVLREAELIAIEGELSYLIDVLNILEKEKYKCVKVKNYQKTHCKYFTDSIHRWMMNGCPDLGFLYRLNYGWNDGRLRLREITTDDVVLNFVGLSSEYLEITDRKTGDEWDFTNTWDYAHVSQAGKFYLQKVSRCFRPKGSNQSQFITPELQTRADTLMRPVQAMFTKNYPDKEEIPTITPTKSIERWNHRK